MIEASVKKRIGDFSLSANLGDGGFICLAGRNGSGKSCLFRALAGQLPIDDQVARFRAALSRNRTLTEVLARAAVMDLPGWYLVAGCLYQTV